MPWIKVKDQLPPPEEKEYLVSDGQYVDVYWWKKFIYSAKKYEWTWSDRDEWFDMTVTHWMPLPEVPNE